MKGVTFESEHKSVLLSSKERFVSIVKSQTIKVYNSDSLLTVCTWSSRSNDCNFHVCTSGVESSAELEV